MLSEAKQTLNYDTCMQSINRYYSFSDIMMSNNVEMTRTPHFFPEDTVPGGLKELESLCIFLKETDEESTQRK